MNSLKSIAIGKGEEYYAKYLALESRKSSLNDLV
jgi:hypothetical protein